MSGPDRARRRTAAARRAVVVAVLPLVWGCRCRPAPTPGPVPAPGPVTVMFPNAAATDRPLLLYTGTWSTGCAHYAAHVGSPNVALAELGTSTACRLELDVFAPRFGAYGRQLSASAPADVSWISSVLAAGSATIPLPEPRTVDLKVWLVADPGDQGEAAAIADLQVGKLNPFLETQGVGVKVAWVRQSLALTAVPHDCALAGSIASSPSVYDATRINAYFVPHYLNAPYARYGMSCWAEGHPEILFISFANEFTPDVTLLHELGHALALRYPNSVVGGHTNGEPGFDAQNLMYSGAAEILNVSVGQMYRINFADIAWLNRPGAAGPSAMPRECQPTWGSGPCPALTQFVGSWP